MDPTRMPPLFFFNDTATTEIYTLSLHDALPICRTNRIPPQRTGWRVGVDLRRQRLRKRPLQTREQQRYLGSALPARSQQLSDQIGLSGCRLHSEYRGRQGTRIALT